MTDETNVAGDAEPSSHETASDYPADDLDGTPTGGEQTPGGDEPSSHETAGEHPAEDVAASYAEPPAAPEPPPESPPA